MTVPEGNGLFCFPRISMFYEAETMETLRGVSRGCPEVFRGPAVPGFKTYRLADTLCSPQVLLKKTTNKQILTCLNLKGKLIFS